MDLPSVGNDPALCGIILHPFPALQRPYGAKIQIFLGFGPGGRRHGRSPLNYFLAEQQGHDFVQGLDLVLVRERDLVLVQWQDRVLAQAPLLWRG